MRSIIMQLSLDHTTTHVVCVHTYYSYCLYFTPRFYNRLPEVRRKKLEEKRSATYELNRNKAKIYQEVCEIQPICTCM